MYLLKTILDNKNIRITRVFWWIKDPDPEYSRIRIRNTDGKPKTLYMHNCNCKVYLYLLKTNYGNKSSLMQNVRKTSSLFSWPIRRILSSG